MEWPFVFIVVTMLFFTSRLDNIRADESLKTDDNFLSLNSTVHLPTERQTVSVARTITSKSSLKSTGAVATTEIALKAMKTTRAAMTMKLTTATEATTTTTTATANWTPKIENATKTTLAITQPTRFMSTYSQKLSTRLISSAAIPSVNILHVSSSFPLLTTEVFTSVENRSLGFTSVATAASVLSATSFSRFGTNSTIQINKETKAPSSFHRNATSVVSHSITSFFHTLIQHSSTNGDYQRSSSHNSSASPPLSEGEMHSTVLPSAIVTTMTISTKQINKDTKTSSSLHYVYRSPTSVVSRPLSSFFHASTLYKSTSNPSPPLSKVQIYSTVLPSVTGTAMTTPTGNVTVILAHPKNKKIKPGIIAAAVLVPLVVIAFGLVGCVKYWRHRRQTELYRHSLLHQMDNL